MKSNKGITLIALVITIIVLLILAGVSISLSIGSNGIIGKAVQAKNVTDRESLKEEIELAITAREIDDDNNSLKQTLEKELSGEKNIEEISGISDAYYVTRNGQTITVYEDGEIEDGRISIWDGETIECPEFKNENNIWNWYIYTPGQLKFLADFVNNSNTLTESQEALVTDKGYNTADVAIVENETTVYLMNNLDMGARPGEGSTEEEKWETENNENKKWIPIGRDSFFSGIFEGNEFYIRGIYVNETTMFSGLFGQSYEIRNLSIKDSYIKSSDYVIGAIVGACYDRGIKNCHNINATVVSVKNNNEYSYAGGIVGQSIALIENCTNKGKIIGTGKGVGGIVGCLYEQKVQKCNNNGIIYSEKNNTGGIVGYATSSATIDNCINNGIIYASGNNTGGIVGYATSSAVITNCKNNMEINGKAYTGGVIGKTKTIIQITNCINIGQITGETNVGGIVGGTIGDDNPVITNCTDSGTVNIIENT